MNEELKQFIKSDIFRQLEKYFTDEAEKIKLGKIDRSRPYEEQGMESHARELAAEAIKSTVAKLRGEATAEPFKKISYK